MLSTKVDDLDPLAIVVVFGGDARVGSRRAMTETDLRSAAAVFGGDARPVVLLPLHDNSAFQ